MTVELSQTRFIKDFKNAFLQRTQQSVEWSGGQKLDNCARLKHNNHLRRNGICKTGERFELGDLRFEYQGYCVIVEYESGPISVHNLLKYWPYILGDLNKVPTAPILLCHFSNWGSWGSHRDLWNWLMLRMEQDETAPVKIIGRQFDHGYSDPDLRQYGIQKAIDWIIDKCQADEKQASADAVKASHVSCQCSG